MPKTFDCKTYDGKPIVIGTESTDRLTAIYQSPDSTDEKRQWAKELLEYAAQRIDAAKDQPPHSQAAARMLVEWELSWILDGSYRLVSKTVNGIVHRELEPDPACPLNACLPHLGGH